MGAVRTLRQWSGYRAGAVGTARSQVLDVGFEGKRDIKGARVTPASGALSTYWLR